MSLLEDFFEVYRVDGEKQIALERGQSLWDKCVSEYNAPLWLVRMYNPGRNLDKLSVGETFTVPLVLSKKEVTAASG